MSVVTNIILVLPSLDDKEWPEAIAPINAYIEEKEEQKGFVCLDDESLPRGWYGGAKMLEADVFAGSFNYISLSNLLAFLSDLKLNGLVSQTIQIFVKEQEDERFRLIDVECKRRN